MANKLSFQNSKLCYVSRFLKIDTLYARIVFESTGEHTFSSESIVWQVFHVEQTDSQRILAKIERNVSRESLCRTAFCLH